MEPYPHQVKVYDLLAQGRNVILRAPTGAGKTQASLYPYLAAMDKTSNISGRLPRKCIYNVPMRVLAKQFSVEYKRTVSRYNTQYGTAIATAIQTGDMPDDPLLERNLIFATVDQTLSSFLMAPYSLSRGKANMNLGAILSSYLVFDEFHLYDPDSTLPTVLQMLRVIKGITPFVLMTATFSHTLITHLAELLDAETVGISEEDRTTFGTLQSQHKTRRYHASRDPLTSERVLEMHQGRSIVICNTVARARQMAQRLTRLTTDSDVQVILLHSQFLRTDRDRIEDEIRTHFGKSAHKSGRFIVVSTQAIEVGVDITSTVMHTELAPANTIIQRAGRCARYQDDVGDVYIYRWVSSGEDVIDLTEKTNPYSGDLQRPQMAATFTAFQEVDGQVLDFNTEQAIIDAVHGDADRQLLSGLGAEAAEHRRQMFAAMRGDRDNVGDLVRKVIAQPVTIHDDPDSVEIPYHLPSFSLHPGSLRGYVSAWLARFHTIMDDTEAPPFAVKYLHSETDPDNSMRTLHRWIQVREKANEVPYGTLIAVHPMFASYNSVEGFLPEAAGGWQTDMQQPDDEATGYGGFSYRLETYAEHIRLVHKAAFDTDPDIGHTAYWEELEWAAARLAEQIGVTPAAIRQAAELTVALHDVGKLSTGWQGWVREYQRKIGQPVDPGEAYAHTTRSTDSHREIERKMHRRPPHAVESAVASTPLLVRLPEQLYQAVFTAISRHHGAFTETYTPIQLEQFAADKVSETLKQPVPTLVDGSYKGRIDPKNSLVQPGDSTLAQFFLYAVLARLLRRADVTGTRWGQHD